MQCCDELLQAHGGIGVAVFAEIAQKYIVELPLSLHYVQATITTTTTTKYWVHMHVSVYVGRRGGGHQTDTLEIASNFGSHRELVINIKMSSKTKERYLKALFHILSGRLLSNLKVSIR